MKRIKYYNKRFLFLLFQLYYFRVEKHKKKIVCFDDHLYKKNE